MRLLLSAADGMPLSRVLEGHHLVGVRVRVSLVRVRVRVRVSLARVRVKVFSWVS